MDIKFDSIEGNTIQYRLMMITFAAFAIAGLVTENIKIENENCVAKSFPSFWDVFESL